MLLLSGAYYLNLLWKKTRYFLIGCTISNWNTFPMNSAPIARMNSVMSNSSFKTTSHGCIAHPRCPAKCKSSVIKNISLVLLTQWALPKEDLEKKRKNLESVPIGRVTIFDPTRNNKNSAIDAILNSVKSRQKSFKWALP